MLPRLTNLYQSDSLNSLVLQAVKSASLPNLEFLVCRALTSTEDVGLNVHAQFEMSQPIFENLVRLSGLRLSDVFLSTASICSLTALKLLTSLDMAHVSYDGEDEVKFTESLTKTRLVNLSSFYSLSLPIYSAILDKIQLNWVELTCFVGRPALELLSKRSLLISNPKAFCYKTPGCAILNGIQL